MGLKAIQRRRLERLLHRRVDPCEVVSVELGRVLCELSFEIRRQVGVLIDRKGKIREVIVGDARQIEISKMRRFRAGRARLRGVRFIHTHLDGSPLSHDDLTDLALLRFDLIAALEVLESGKPGRIFIAYLRPYRNDGDTPWVEEPSCQLSALDVDCQGLIKGLEDEFAGTYRKARQVDMGRRRAILVGVTTGPRELMEDSMNELEALAESAEVKVVDRVLQRRPRLDPKFVVGRGKMKELYIKCMQMGADLMIFDTELSGSQVRAVSEFGEIEVWDRTQLILDIFARRARTRGGKLQVELAMLKYSLPRLVMKDDFLSRLTGGIGAKGPGETKIEVLRRRIRDRICRLEAELERLSRERKLRRKVRKKDGIPVISIIGYTNAGKSTLLNTLTRSNVQAEDRLFATLDPTSRRLRLPGGATVILTDTVGFIRELPRELTKAFRATLEELHDADLLLHLVDISDSAFVERILAVQSILADLALDNIPMQVVFNKVDRISISEKERILQRWPFPAVSALDKSSTRPLLELLESIIFKGIQPCPREFALLSELSI